MRRLILLRHAKATPADDGPDRDRDLDARGVADAAWAGTAIAAGGWAPDAALVSDALRTRQTFALASPHLPKQPTLRLEPRLYDASCPDILDCIATTPDAVACLLVVGHNPGIAAAAVHLTQVGGAPAPAALSRGFPTAAVAVLALDIAGWSGIRAGTATLDAFRGPH